MPRYKLFLLERPSADPRTVQRAAWALPSALDVAKLTKALKGEIEVDWLEIAASDKKREILKIQHVLGEQGCMLAIDDAGSTLTKDLTGAVRQALSREGRRQSRDRARAATIWERGEGWRAIPVTLARNARAIASGLAALAVLGGSVVLLAVWMNGAPRAGGGGGDASTLDRLAALSRGDANLPAIPESADGAGGASEPGEPVSRGGARPSPTAEPGGGRSEIPDVPSGGVAAASGAARAPKPGSEPSSGTRSIEIAGFAVGIGWAALVEGVARRGSRRSRGRAGAVLMRLVPAAVAGGLSVAALIAMEARTAPTARAAAPRSAPTTQSGAAVSRHGDNRKPLAPARSASAARQARPATPSYRALVAALAPAPDPCAQVSGSLARFLCLERLRHPDAAEAVESEGPAHADAGAAEGTATRAETSVPSARAEASSPPASGAPAAAPAGAKSSASTAPSTSTPPSGAPDVGPTPRAAPPAVPSAAPAAPTAAPGAAPSPIGAGPKPSSTPPTDAVSSPSRTPPAPPATAKPAPSAAAARPAVAARRNLLAALPTFLLGLLAGTVGLAIVALGTGGRPAAEGGS